MSQRVVTPSHNNDPGRILRDCEDRVIELFGGIGHLLGFPRSLGSLYGLLFVSDTPLCLDEITARLGVSKGGVSMGLRQLREVGAILVAKREGDRRDFYAPELQLRRLVRAMLQDKVIPQLERGGTHLRNLQELASALPTGQSRHLRDRLGKLNQWHRRANSTLPLAMQLLRD